MSDLEKYFMPRISREQMIRQIAHVISCRSTCNRLHVGAVIHRQGRILATGYNGPPSGQPHCNHTEEETECKLATHAEANAIAFAARYGMSTEGAELFITHSPCVACAHLIINSGLRNVTYDKEYRDTSGIQLIMNSGIPVYDLR